ncbi:MAG: hypothetical protein HY364_00235 [Candidatus Aenigmarchaeota archaeon]|nr:hypothetical protein [Candidatus Aenigmarchaeota archaeon]
MHVTAIAVVVAFIIGIFVSWVFIGAAAAVIFTLIFLEKVLAGFFDGINNELGIEFITVPMILAGIVYGPMTAFLFGFFGLPFLEAIRWMIKTPALSGGWPPLIPSPDVAVDAIVGAAAGILVLLIPVEWAGIICIIMKGIIAPIKDSLVYGIPPRPTIVINVMFNIIIFELLIFVVKL